MMSKDANNKRQRVSAEGGVEDPWNKKQCQQIGLPSLFKMFEGKLPKHLVEDSVENKEDMVDINLNIYGTEEQPIFLAADIGKLCHYKDRNVIQQCQSYRQCLFCCYIWINITHLTATVHDKYMMSANIWAIHEC